jgi:hypothetical protein
MYSASHKITSNPTTAVTVNSCQWQKPDRAEIPAAPDVAKLVEGYKGRATVAAGETFDATARISINAQKN